ncbi:MULTISPECIES: glycosyltransferase family 87 protein [unclassified Lentimicrobium]|uniref:glycosyltransferase family 87 protein n=1 Tax=unclassified Lentimicrobium TaxID=2677434 RepID=UPI001557A06F|nr:MULTISPECIES: glycosyltransferase family 87 protein [unclassified Lentimicrobium]NPD44241.1 DUF2029 domain-containing protein [Lentimicrobium sp. S6]NPD85779.1 DUF2029 domain-containing protein [Lentimicrobium sp. L6]
MSTLLFRGEKTFGVDENLYSHYNNYEIFKYSHHHLFQGKNLYVIHPTEHFDFFKYSPSFAVFFGVFSHFPDWIGLMLWSLLNALLLVYSFYYLPRISNFSKGLMVMIVLLELITALLNAQSNALLAALMILSFGKMEKGKEFWASFFMVSSVFIKVFGLVGFAIFLLYPKKWKVVLYSFFWFAVWLILPLAFINLEKYQFLVESWMNLLGAEKITYLNFSFLSVLKLISSVPINNLFIQVLGVVVFLIPMLFCKKYQFYRFRLLTLASILIWVVIFNHRAESPTFVIAMAGIAIWFVASPKNKWNIALFASSIILTSLALTDAFPPIVRREFIVPYSVKAWPCIAIWFKIVYDMLMLREDVAGDLLAIEK